MFDETEDVRQFSFWPSVSDLFMTCFILALAVLAAFWYIIQPTSNVDYKAVVEVMGGVELTRIKEPTNKMRAVLETLPQLKPKESPETVVAGLAITADEVVRQHDETKSEVKRLKEENKALERRVATLGEEKKVLENALNDKPPIIKIAEEKKDGKEQYRFSNGKAEVDKNFRDALKIGGFTVLATEIVKRNRTRPASVDTLEIIGHTDGAAFKEEHKEGNLDNLLPAFLAGGTRDELAKLIPGSNNDLGLLRALAIKIEWLEFVEQTEDKEELKKVEVRCYSAGQTIPEGTCPEDARLRDTNLFKQGEPNFRRIEIRLTKLRSPSFFSLDDVVDPPLLAGKLISHSDPVSQFVWERFSTKSQKVLTAPSSVEIKKAVLVEELNKVLKAGQLYSEHRFEKVKLSPQTVTLNGRNPQGEDLEQLNRLLLNDAYPEELRRNQLR